ncbi:MAG: Gfo/Idh/MocA family oxidoreductase, partial [Lentisphaeria bacterium]|nr:Gfo/Idh/MocA family oxidoreductase [Lentisphaeria bacterium]
MKRIKVGIIGQGRSGRNIHRHLFETQPELQKRFEVIAVADPIPERRKLDGITPSPKFQEYDDYKKMIKNEEIELFINASRSPGHIPISIELLKAGRNVISEKPLARHVADVEKLEKAIKQSGKFFAVFQQTRFRPLFRKSFEIMKSGILGRIVMVKIEYNGFSRRWDWQTIQDMCAGELLNTGPHPLDLALQFYGDGEADPEQIFCKMDRANTFGDAEDHIKLLLAGKGHPTIDMEVSRCCMFPGNTFNIYGTNGGLKANGDEITWRYFKPDEAPEQKLVKEPL